MRIPDRNLHRILALVAFGLYFLYLIRAAARSGKSPIKSQDQADQHAVETKKIDPIQDSIKKDVPKEVSENQFIKISTEGQSTIKENIGFPLAKIPPSLKVSQVRVRSGSLVDAVQFVMADGTVKTGGYVASGGDAAPSFGLDPVFVLNADEHILKIEVSQQDRLAGLRIVSTKGKVSQWYGTQRGERKTFVASADNPIVNIEREAGGICTRIIRAQRLDGSALEPANRQRKARASGAAVPPHLRVTQVRVRAGDLIDLLEFAMADGSVVNGGYSATGGRAQPPFDLEADEAIVRIEAGQGAALEGVRVRTSKGRESPWYGKQFGAAVKAFAGDADNPIVGFDRGMAGVCPAIVGVRLLDEAE